MLKEIIKDDKRILLKPQKTYKDVGGVQIKIQKQKFSEQDDEMGSLVLYQDYVGDAIKNENGFQLQLRAFKKLTEHSQPKSIIVSLSVSDSEIMALADMVMEAREKYKTIKIKK